MTPRLGTRSETGLPGHRPVGVLARRLWSTFDVRDGHGQRIGRAVAFRFDSHSRRSDRVLSVQSGRRSAGIHDHTRLMPTHDHPTVSRIAHSGSEYSREE